MISQVSGNIKPAKRSNRRKILLGVLLVLIIVLAATGYLWWRGTLAETGEAPEAESILEAQVQLPFQVLIPAYLPRGFVRSKTQVNLDGTGPRGEPMVEITYYTRAGETLAFKEWLPGEQEAGGRKAAYCLCVCISSMDCNSVEMGMTIGSLKVSARVSSPDILTSEEARAVIDTLGPAVNREVITSLEQVPESSPASPAVEIPVNSEGIQELTLVVTPNGYNPEHFSVRKGVAVRLTFRQLGQVGCGNELIIQWGKGKSATIYLASPGDSQTLEFIPTDTGDFRFNCPHLYYRGVMTVLD